MNKAAKKFFISQPALSSAITSLEEELGITLIKRNRQGISLTEAGEKVYRDSLCIMDNVKSWQYLHQGADIPHETISVGTTEVPSYLIMPKVIAELEKNYPHIHVLIKNLDFDYTKLSGESDTDIYIASTRNNAKLNTSSRFQQEDVYIDYYCAYLNAKSPLATKPFVTLNDLLREKLVMYYQSAYLTYIDENIYPHNRILFSEHKEAILSMVAKNNYVSIFQSMRQFDNHYVSQGQICVRPIIDHSIMYKHMVVYPTTNRISPTQKIVVDFIKKAYAELSIATLDNRKKIFAPIGITDFSVK